LGHSQNVTDTVWIVGPLGQAKSYSFFVENMYFLYSVGVVTFNKREITLSLVSFERNFTKLSGIDGYEKCINMCECLVTFSYAL
jgi:hypothetical protein